MDEIKTTIEDSEDLAQIVSHYAVTKDKFILNVMFMLYQTQVVLPDQKEDWGITINVHCVFADIEPEYILSHALGHYDIPEKILEKFSTLKLFGNRDCPRCGGLLEYYDGEYTQDEMTGKKTFLWEENQCYHCKHITKTK